MLLQEREMEEEGRLQEERMSYWLMEDWRVFQHEKGRTRRREEETGAVEVIGLENTNGLENVTTARGGVDGGGGS